MQKSLKRQTALKLLKSGQAQRQQGRAAEAVATLARALSFLPDDPEILTSLAGAHDDLGEHDRARELRSAACASLLDTINAGTREHWPHKLLAIALSKNGEHEKSSAVLAHALSRRPQLALYFFPKGILTDNPAHLTAYADADDEEIARLAESPAPRVRHYAQPGVLTLMGHALTSRKSFMLAGLCFRKEIECYPGNEGLILFAGVCHAMNYEWDDAAACFERARAHYEQTIAGLFGAAAPEEVGAAP